MVDFYFVAKSWVERKIELKGHEEEDDMREYNKGSFFGNNSDEEEVKGFIWGFRFWRAGVKTVRNILISGILFC